MRDYAPAMDTLTTADAQGDATVEAFVRELRSELGRDGLTQAESASLPVAAWSRGRGRSAR